MRTALGALVVRYCCAQPHTEPTALVPAPGLQSGAVQAAGAAICRASQSPSRAPDGREGAAVSAHPNYMIAWVFQVAICHG
jgi:hypothetical protein